METEENDHQDVAEPDIFASGMAGTGQENEELRWMRSHAVALPAQAGQTTGTDNDMPCNPAIIQSSPKLVERKTALRGQAIDPPPKPKRPARSRTEKDLLAYDSDILYAAVEKANRDLVCSLIDRQDRVSEGLLLIINDLQYRVDDIELALGTKLKQGKGRVPE